MLDPQPYKQCSIRLSLLIKCRRWSRSALADEERRRCRRRSRKETTKSIGAGRRQRWLRESKESSAEESKESSEENKEIKGVRISKVRGNRELGFFCFCLDFEPQPQPIFEAFLKRCSHDSCFESHDPTWSKMKPDPRPDSARTGSRKTWDRTIPRFELRF